jgi:toxin-antitoxin system PIN domain toxin
LISLPDVNVLLALAWSNHPHHDAAHEWFSRDATLGWATCLLTESAFLRLSLNFHVVRVIINSSTAIQLLKRLSAHTHHQFVDVAPSVNGPPFDELVRQITGYRQVPDATLLHLARSQGARLVTFDQAIAGICPWSENLLVLSTSAQMQS